MTRSTSMISPYETRYNDEIDFYVKSPKHLLRGNVVTITKSKVLLDFGTKELISLSKKDYIEILTQMYMILNTSYILTTRPKTLSNKLKTNLNNWLTKKMRVGESIDVKIESIESIESIALINIKDSLDYIKTTKLFHELEEVKKSDQVIKGFVLKKIKGGFSVAIGGIIAFLPTKQVLKRPDRKLLNKFVNTSIYLKISRITFETRNIILRKA
jgi:ribosomal protein S1